MSEVVQFYTSVTSAHIDNDVLSHKPLLFSFVPVDAW